MDRAETALASCASVEHGTESLAGTHSIVSVPRLSLIAPNRSEVYRQRMRGNACRSGTSCLLVFSWLPAGCSALQAVSNSLQPRQQFPAVQLPRPPDRRNKSASPRFVDRLINTRSRTKKTKKLGKLPNRMSDEKDEEIPVLSYMREPNARHGFGTRHVAFTMRAGG